MIWLFASLIATAEVKIKADTSPIEVCYGSSHPTCLQLNDRKLVLTSSTQNFERKLSVEQAAQVRVDLNQARFSADKSNEERELRYRPELSNPDPCFRVDLDLGSESKSICLSDRDPSTALFLEKIQSLKQLMSRAL